jgi:hypothetical protein
MITNEMALDVHHDLRSIVLSCLLAFSNFACLVLMKTRLPALRLDQGCQNVSSQTRFREVRIDARENRVTY